METPVPSLSSRIRVDPLDPVFHAILTEALEQGGDLSGAGGGRGVVYVTMQPYGETLQGEHVVLVDRPFRVGQVLNAIRRALEEYGHSQSIGIGPYSLRIVESVLLREGGPPVRLTDRERDLLVALARAEGCKLDRREILENIWGYVEGVETHTVETLVYRLRQKMEPDPANPTILLTDGSGYRIG